MRAGSLAGVGVGGALLEISKRDIWSPARLAQDRPDICYTLLAVDFLPPSAVQSALTRAAAAVSQGSFRPLPQVSHALGNAQSALRQMSQAKHVGKVVVTCASSQHAASRSNSQWVVTGGLGSLGSLASSWLSQQGAQNLMLLGRTAKLVSRQSPLTQLLQDASNTTMVTVTMADMACQEDAQLQQYQLSASGQLLHGVIHASGTLADATLQKQSLAGLRRVFAAKVGSIQKLSNAAAAQPTKQQVLFSSVAALLGSAGQANYSAANGVLDGMAGQWQGEGRGGVSSIQWGGWAGGGMAGADPTTASRLARMGMPLISPQQGLAALSGVLAQASASPVLAAVPLDWGRFLQQGDNMDLPMFSDQAIPSQAAAASIPEPALSTQTQVHTQANAHNVGHLESVSTALQATITSLLGRTVDPTAPLMAAGVDSLSSVELRNALQSRFGIHLPSTLVFDYPTANDIAAFIAAQAAVATSGPSTAEASRPLLPLPGQTLRAAEPPRQQQQQQQQHSVCDVVSQVVSNILGKAVGTDVPLMTAGLDSLAMVEVRNALQTSLHLQLPSTLLFDFPTIDAITGYITSQLGADVPQQQVQTSAAAPVQMMLNPVDVQQHGTYLGATVVTALVMHMPDGALMHPRAVDSPTLVPLDRWDGDQPPDGLFTFPAVRFGSYLSNPAAFDAAAFGTSEAEAMYMDPQQRLLLQATAEALSSSQLQPNSRSSTAVFVGVSSSDYDKLVRVHSRGVTAYTATGAAASVTSGRLSYTFGLKGPSVAVDTACSSSLVSLHMAHNSLMLQQSHAAVNSGVNVMLSPYTQAAFQKAGMLAADGRCKTLDSHADG